MEDEITPEEMHNRLIVKLEEMPLDWLVSKLLEYAHDAMVEEFGGEIVTEWYDEHTPIRLATLKSSERAKPETLVSPVCGN